MQLPPGATSYSPPPGPLHCGLFSGQRMRHTVRPDGGKDWLILYTLRGSGLYRQAGEIFTTHPGHLTLYRRGTPQDYRHPPGRDWELFYTHFTPKPEWISWLDWPELTPGFMRIDISASPLRRRLTNRFTEMIRLNYGAEPRREALALNALEEILLWCDSLNPGRAAPRMDPRVRRAMEYLSESCAEPFSEEKTGRAAGLSGSRLRHLFRAQTGQSPRAFQEQERMRRAAILLAQSNQSVSEIAAELGFENPFYFSLRFRKHSGKSPREFRRAALGPERV